MLGKSLQKMKNWLLQEDEEPRRAPRARQPEIVVHYWDGSAPEGRQLRDISESGAYIYTSERWYPGTMIRIILQGYQTEVNADGTLVPKASTVITARVIRHGPDGVAVEFAFRDKEEEATLRAFLAEIPAQPLRATGTETSQQRKGQALIEFSLIIPLVFLLAVNAVNFAGFLFAWITVANAARAGAQYMTLSNASPGSLPNATTAQVTALVTSDVASLLNRSSIKVVLCSNATTAATTCTGAAVCPVDPEAPTYTLATVDVTYTYLPFIPLFSFPKMGISATLPPTNIHRRAVMRMLQ